MVVTVRECAEKASLRNETKRIESADWPRLASGPVCRGSKLTGEVVAGWRLVLSVEPYTHWLAEIRVTVFRLYGYWTGELRPRECSSSSSSSSLCCTPVSAQGTSRHVSQVIVQAAAPHIWEHGDDSARGFSG